MAYNCVVAIKQVPDTKRITGEAMNADGTVNRGALPAVFNPEDLNALELALDIKDKFGGKVTVITMGLPAASTVLREALYRGADDAILITDRKAAASDTLATSYILSCAVKKLDYDIVLCGRQAIDGDTAQVGPQMAEKLGIPQVTYIEELLTMENRHLSARRNIGNGWQEIKCKLPVLMTVIDEANEPRVPVAIKLMKYKKARTPIEIQMQLKKENPNASDAELKQLADMKIAELAKQGLLIKQWDLNELQADMQWCGRDGSPTKVHRIQSVVLTARESKTVEASEQGITDMIHELITDKTIS
ncbi:MAG: Acryloyl-CoA reductase electron transfer subunit gamma [Planctomycetes bacterium ADurb.Bin401]|nr:MAG: Acryloyl-CoA reductase electron transfer subunit gamma [Planctomycetes bacterium ADurb.Bin401]